MKKPKIKSKLWRAVVYQNGIAVAFVEHTDPKIVRREIRHYAAQYAANGPVIVSEPILVTAPPRRKRR